MIKSEYDKRTPGRFGSQPIDISVPVLILGGKENSLSLTRSLARAGISASVSGPGDCWGMYSKYCKTCYRVPTGDKPEHFWQKLLLGTKPLINDRHVILPCCDASIAFLAENEETLRQRFIFDGGSKQQRMALLDKRKTLEMADAADVATPKYWPVEQGGELDGRFTDCKFPVIVKPLNTFKFAKVFSKKFLVAETGIDELKTKIRMAHDKGFDVTVTEKIPGPDTQLSSYYTYVDDDGRFLFHFTKRIIRRFPENSGGATYHATQWLPETADQGIKFFKKTGFRGLGNIEFKRDTRDGKLKIMEVNARFTAAQELAVRAGAPIDLIVYCQLTGQKIPSFSTYENDLRFWYPIKDFLAMMQLRRMGKITFSGWLRELRGHRTVSPLIDSGDRKPYSRVANSLFKKVLASR